MDKRANYDKYCFKKTYFSDRLAILLLVAASAVEILVNSFEGYYSPVFLTLRIVSSLGLLPVSILYKYGTITRSKIVWFFMGLIAFPVMISYI